MQNQQSNYQINVYGYTTDDGVTFRLDTTKFRNVYSGNIDDLDYIEVSQFDGYTQYESTRQCILEFEQLQPCKVQSDNRTPYELAIGERCYQIIDGQSQKITCTTGGKLVQVYDLEGDWIYDQPYYPEIVIDSLVRLNIAAEYMSDYYAESIVYDNQKGLKLQEISQNDQYTRSQSVAYDETTRTYDTDVLRSMFQIQREGQSVDTNNAELYRLGNFVGNQDRTYKLKTWCNQYGFSQVQEPVTQQYKYQYQSYQWAANELNKNVTELVIPVKDQQEFSDLKLQFVSSGQYGIQELTSFYQTPDSVQSGFKDMVDQLQIQYNTVGYGFIPQDSVVQLVQISDIVSIRTVQPSSESVLQQLYNQNTQFECKVQGKLRKVYQIQQTGYQQVDKGGEQKFEFTNPISNVIILRAPSSQQLSQSFLNGQNTRSEAQQTGNQLVFDQDPRSELSFTVSQPGNTQVSTTYQQTEQNGLFAAFIVSYDSQYTEPIQYNDGYQYKQYIRSTGFQSGDKDLYSDIITDDQLFMRQSDGFKVKQFSQSGYTLSLKDFIVIKSFPLLDNQKFDFYDRKYETYRYTIYYPSQVFGQFRLSDIIKEAD